MIEESLVGSSLWPVYKLRAVSLQLQAVESLPSRQPPGSECQDLSQENHIGNPLQNLPVNRVNDQALLRSWHIYIEFYILHGARCPFTILVAYVAPLISLCFADAWLR